MKVKTYAVNCNDAWLNTEGDDISESYVKYKDFRTLQDKFQSYCKHDGGRMFDGVINTRCPICFWDTALCQHRRSKVGDKYCIDCGEKLKKDELMEVK